MVVNIVELWHLLYQLDAEYVVHSLFPVRSVQLFSSIDDLITLVFRCQLKGLRIVHLNKSLEILANNSLVNQILVLCNVRDLEDHSTDHISTFQKLKVNLHMEWYLSLEFILFKFHWLVLDSGNTLCKYFSKSLPILIGLSMNDVNQCIVALLK